MFANNLPCLQCKLPCMFIINNKDQSSGEIIKTNTCSLRLLFTITTHVLELCPHSVVVIDHKSKAIMHYLSHNIPPDWSSFSLLYTQGSLHYTCERVYRNSTWIRLHITYYDCSMYMYLLIESYNKYKPWEISVIFTVEYKGKWDIFTVFGHGTYLDTPMSELLHASVNQASAMKFPHSA